MANTFKNYGAKDITTSTSTIFTATATATVIIGLWVSNTSANQINVDVWVTIGGVDYYIVKDAPIPVGGALIPIGAGAKTVLESGDALKINSDTVTSADALASVLEIT